MQKNKLIVSYWADSELAFIKFSEKICSDKDINFKLHKISHHADWFNHNRSYLKNFLHLSKEIRKIITFGIGGNVCAFGTNICRILFFFSWLFKDTFFVYNELPEYKPKSPLFWLDKIIFKYAKNIFVSTQARAEFIKTLYNLRREIKIVENITIHDIPSINTDQRKNSVVFSGTITPKRFNPSDLIKFKHINNLINCKIDVYGFVAKEISNEFLTEITNKGHVSHEKMLSLLKEYKYALLTYYTEEPNYDLCAPLKLYEYIACGCIVISINKNTGLKKIAEKFPNLIYFLDDLKIYNLMENITSLEYEAERENFLSAALETNRKFSKIISS